MRNVILLAAACTLIASKADTFIFDIGPDNGQGFGLNGANERPTTTSSSATGDEIKALNSNVYVQYDDVTKVLELHFGWGSEPSLDYENGGTAGTDLQADLVGMHIHGPADVDGSTGVLYNLLTLAADPGRPADEGFYNPNGNGRTGAIDLRVQLVDNPNSTTFSVADQQAQLLGNMWYINLHTDGTQGGFPGGEIRGQLILIPEPHHYAAIAGLGLLGFAGYRRFKTARA